MNDINKVGCFVYKSFLTPTNSSTWLPKLPSNALLVDSYSYRLVAVNINCNINNTINFLKNNTESIFYYNI